MLEALLEYDIVIDFFIDMFGHKCHLSLCSPQLDKALLSRTLVSCLRFSLILLFSSFLPVHFCFAVFYSVLYC